MPRFLSADLRVALAAGLLAAGAVALPDAVVATARLAVRDALAPGQSLAAHVADPLGALARLLAPSSNAEQAGPEAASPNVRRADADTQRDLEAARTEARHWRLQAERFREEIRRLRAAASATPVGPPLVSADLVEARLLDEAAGEVVRSGRFVDVGAARDVKESAAVLEARGPLVDLGAAAQLASGQHVLDGRTLVGRLAHVGRWTSAVQLVTDVGYRGHARLARPTADGFAFGSDGILEGDGGRTCRLRYVSSQSAVAVGDQVVSEPLDPLLRDRCLYGTVVHAELLPGAPHWDIRVQPAADPEQIRAVHILRRKLHPDRQLAN